jgi:hypothetical protein
LSGFRPRVFAGRHVCMIAGTDGASVRSHTLGL